MYFRRDESVSSLYPGLRAGCRWDLDDILQWKPDVFVVLDRLPASVWDVTAVRDDPDVAEAARRIDDELGEAARLLIRFSGVEPEIRVLVQAPGEALCDKYMDAFIDVLWRKGHLDQEM